MPPRGPLAARWAARGPEGGKNQAFNNSLKKKKIMKKYT